MQIINSVSRMRQGFLLYCLLLFLKGSRSSRAGAPGKAFVILQVVFITFVPYLHCQSVPLSEEVTSSRGCYAWHTWNKEHFTDSTGSSLPRQSIGCTLSFPVSSRGYWNFRTLVGAALGHYGCCCAFIPSHCYAFKFYISCISTINSLTMVISCNKLHCLVFVQLSDVLPFGVVWEDARTLLDLYELCYSPVVTSSPLSLIILDSSLSWVVLFLPLLTAEVLVSLILFILVSGSLCCWCMMWNCMLITLYNISSGSTIIL